MGLVDVPTLGTRARTGAVGLNVMGIACSRLRATELGGIGMLAERDCRVDMLKVVSRFFSVVQCKLKLHTAET